jgi:hypothetical protein
MKDEGPITTRQALEFFNQTFSILVEDAPFLASSKRSRERNAPSPGWFDLVVWNVVIAFLVNLLSSVAYDQLRKLQRHFRPGQSDGEHGSDSDLTKRLTAAHDLPMDPDLLAEALHTLTALKKNPTSGAIATSDASVEEGAVEAAAGVLQDNGWPRDLALRRGREIVAQVNKNVFLS